MSLREDILQEQKIAMKARNADKLSVLRMLWSAIKNLEIEKQHELSDEEIQSVVSKQVKQLKDSQKDFDLGGRQDLVDSAQREIEILQYYLPTQLAEDDIKKVIREVISEIGASSPADIGKVMATAMGRLKGQADGSLVRELTQDILSS